MNRSLTRIPDRLFLLRANGPNGVSVPLPIGELSIEGDFSESVLEILDREDYIVFGHENSEIVVLTAVSSLVEVSEDETVAQFYLITRLKIKKFFKSERRGLPPQCTLDPLPEKKISAEKFNSSAFQKKIEELRILSARFVMRDETKEFVLPPHKHSEKTIGMFVDQAAHKMNAFTKEEAVRNGLIGILEELDVERRLDKTIALYNFYFEKSASFREIRRDRTSLVRMILINKPSQVLSIESEISQNSKIGELVRQLILNQKKKGEENAP